MSRVASFIVAAAFLALVPCEQQGRFGPLAANAQAPTPAPAQIPVKVMPPITKLVIPADRNVGDLIDISVDGTLPDDIELEWSLDGVLATPKTLRPTKGKAVGVALAGQHVVYANGQSAVMVNGVVQLTIVNASGDVGVQPPKPLAELAGVHRQSLVDWYAARRAGIASFLPTTKAADFYAIHVDFLYRQLAMTGKEYETAANAIIEPAIGKGDTLLDTTKFAAAMTELITRLDLKPTDPDKPPVDPNKPTLATAATYVYEKDDTAIPVGVRTGLNRLNREKNIRATLFEDDTVDGDGDVPDQYKVPLAAAKQDGLPALVVTAGSNVLRVVKDPRTESQVFEAIAP